MNVFFFSFYFLFFTFKLNLLHKSFASSYSRCLEKIVFGLSIPVWKC